MGRKKDPNVKRKSLGEETVKIVIARDRGACRFPGCSQWLIEYFTFQNGTRIDQILVNTGQLAHMRGVSPGGPRYDPTYTRKMLNHYSNIVSLCYPHHRIVDQNPDQYPVEEMEKWIRIERRHAFAPLPEGADLGNLPMMSPYLGGRIVSEGVAGTSSYQETFWRLVGRLPYQ